jgi:hypothetical protein
MANPLPNLLVSDQNAKCMKAFKHAEARFLIVGGLAMHVYCPDRNIIGVDADLLIDRHPENVAKVIPIVEKFDWSRILEPAKLTHPRAQRPFRNGLYMEILTPAEDVDFEKLWQNATHAILNDDVDLVVPVIGLEHLKQMKELAARESSTPEKHQRDLEMLIALG